jgi:hypothetical protein
MSYRALPFNVALKQTRTLARRRRESPAQGRAGAKVIVVSWTMADEFLGDIPIATAEVRECFATESLSLE